MSTELSSAQKQFVEGNPVSFHSKKKLKKTRRKLILEFKTMNTKAQGKEARLQSKKKR
jgi:hypothetical protein